MAAALAMYDLPELRWANDALWQRWRTALLARGIEAPDSLTRGQDWDAPDLLVAQTCGLPYALEGKWRLVATPCYQAEGCDGPRYRAALVARVDDSRTDLAAYEGAVVAINAWTSHSGHTALSEALDDIGARRQFFTKARLSGSHLASMDLVAAGDADIASVDCVTWALAGTAGYEAVNRLKVVGWTPSAPGLPLVAARHQSDETVEAIRAALEEAVSDPALDSAREAMLLKGVEYLDEDAYEVFGTYWKRAHAEPVTVS